MSIQFPFQLFKKRLIKYCGMKEATYETYLTDYLNKHGNSEQSKKDYIWYCYQVLLEAFASNMSEHPHEMYKFQRAIYNEMFGFLITEGKDITVAQKGILHCDVKLAALSGLKMNVEILAGNRCDVCDTINGKTFPLEVIMQSSILPFENCTREGGCICQYLFIPI